MARSGAAFVGRERELAFLAERRRECARRPQFVLIGGDAGLGKSRLLAEFRATLQHRPVFLGHGECDEVVPVPFGPFVEIFSEIAPELARRLTGARQNIEHGGDKAALFDAVRETLEACGRRRTTVLFVEDLHFADNGSFELLLYVVRTVQSGRILLLTTYRAEQLSSNEALLRAVARLVRLPGVSTLELPALSDADARAIVNATVPSGIVLEPDLVDEIVASAEGNAFFLEELVKNAADRARSGATAQALPGTIRSVILERLATLSPEDRTVLAHAAILGRSFDVEFLGDVLGLERSRLLQSLRRARNAELIVEDPADEDRLAFRHALTRDAIAADMLAAERRLLHARITTNLEQRPPAYRRAHIADLAYHSFEAGEHVRASRHNEDAGDGAMAVQAYEDAARSYERALAAGTPADRDRARLHRKAGESLSYASHAVRAMRAYESALAMYRLPADVDEIATLHLRIARQQYLLQNVTEAIAQAQRALDVLTTGGSRTLTDFARVSLASYHIFRLDADTALGLTENVRSLDDADVAFLYHNVRMGAFAVRSDLSAFQAEIPLFIGAAERHPNPTELARALHNVGDCAIFTGQSKIAARSLAQSVEISRSTQAHGMRLMCVGRLAFERYLSGQLQHARELARTAIVFHGWNVGVADTATTAILLGLALDDAPLVTSGFSVAEALLESSFSSQMSQAVGPLAAASVAVLVAARRVEEAQSLLSRVLRQIEHPYGSFMALLAAARYATDSDVPRLLDICRRSTSEFSNPLSIAIAAFAEGLVLARAGDAEVAQRFGRSAMQAFRDIGWTLLEAEAAELCDAAAAETLYRAMGHQSGLRRVCGREPAGTADSNPSGLALLSKREREVVELVAAGKGNRAIAQTLQIGEKTVEKHLSSAFSKLGVASRTQLVAALTAPR